jgi:hypothetical protein
MGIGLLSTWLGYSVKDGWAPDATKTPMVPRHVAIGSGGTRAIDPCKSEIDRSIDKPLKVHIDLVRIMEPGVVPTKPVRGLTPP